MIIHETPLAGVRLLEPAIFRDSRGFFLEIFREDRLRDAGIAHSFVQANQSRSLRGTLRGLHWQWRRPQAKLVRVLNGTIYDVVVDIRRRSLTFGQWYGLEMRAEDLRQLYVPVGFAHGFCVLSESADVEYLCSEVYDPGGEAGLLWNDPVLAINWPIDWPLLSERDRTHPGLTADRIDLLE